MLRESDLMYYKSLVAKALQDFDFTRLQLDFSIRCELIEYKNISLVLDVGANTGQYVSSLRQQGYDGKILSFEPLAEEFARLSENAANDPNWNCKQLALGSYSGLREMNRAGNSYSSSLLPMLDRHVENAPDSGYVGKETVSISRLDSLGQDSIGENDRIYLKIDTQGYELEVLKGSERMLQKVEAVELELTVVPLYDRQVLYQQLIQYMDIMGFDLVWMERGFSDQTTGEVLQFDGIFLRR
ncbi:FkbM family methyltransferase [Brevibacillus choshinensis]|nr:FkbM family methyltransferase [Brevibacillus choshinensis]MED4585419.1 FkbM family methyltransferase [Brevibacillus choshinensis]MED4753919.1 FkbM family methyltransferase [Brevibacillus choshinensis]